MLIPLNSRNYMSKNYNIMELINEYKPPDSLITSAYQRMMEDLNKTFSFTETDP
jgi:adenine-specific DNA methylase